MSLSPKVSIVIPVYNGANFLAEAIDSAIQQSYDNIEIVVVNDGSNDHGATEQIALSYGEKIRYFSKPNGGVGSALNFAIEHITGDYFSWLSHDDLYYPDKVKNQIAFLKQLARDDVIVYSDFSAFTHHPKRATPYRLPGRPPQHFRYWLTLENAVHGCTLLIPREALLKYQFNETLRTTQDYDLWFRMAKTYQFIHLAEVLVNSRRHEEQGTAKMSDLCQREIDVLLTNFVTELTQEEVFAATQKSRALAYLHISAMLKMRSALAASAAAEKIANKYKRVESAYISMIFFIKQYFYAGPKRVLLFGLRAARYLKRHTGKYIWRIQMRLSK